MPALRFDNVTKKFGKVLALDRMSLDVSDGEYLCILGPTGSGKTTLLKLMAGLLTPEDTPLTSPEMSVPYGTFKSSAKAKRTHAPPSTKPRQGMPWLRGEATGLPGLRTANLQRDHGLRLESSSFWPMEDVKAPYSLAARPLQM